MHFFTQHITYVLYLKQDKHCEHIPFFLQLVLNIWENLHFKLNAIRPCVDVSGSK